MKKIIAIGLGPNVEKDDAKLARCLLFTPWKYLHGNSVVKIEEWFTNYFKTSYAVSFSSGRAALFAILEALDIGSNDEVILQAFTCVVVPNAILAAGATPVYADIT